MVSKYLLFGVILLAQAWAESKSLLVPKQPPQKIIPCDDLKSRQVIIPYGRVTVLNFPASPKEVIPGEAGFDFKTIRSDLVIKSMHPGAKTNLLVYLEGRRCSFHLSSQPTGDEIIFVRDPKEKTFEVKFHDK